MDVSSVPEKNYPEGGDYGNRSAVNYSTPPNNPRGDFLSGNNPQCNAPSCACDKGDDKCLGTVPQERQEVAPTAPCCCQRAGPCHQQPRSVPSHTDGTGQNKNSPHIETTSKSPAPSDASSYQKPSSKSQKRYDPATPTQTRPQSRASVRSLEHGQNQKMSIPKQSVAQIKQTADVNKQTKNPLPSHSELLEPSQSRHETASSESPVVQQSLETTQQQKVNPQASINVNSGEVKPASDQKAETPAVTLPPKEMPQDDSQPSAPEFNPGQTQMPSKSLKKEESVASLLIPVEPWAPREHPPAEPAPGKNKNPTAISLSHLNFKEKQLALSAINKAASNMSCVKMFEDKDKVNSGTIGRRDFQIVMDRIGVLNGMSSREIDAVFKGFSTRIDTELDYKTFVAACRQAIDGDHRLSRMAQK